MNTIIPSNPGFFVLNVPKDPYTKAVAVYAQEEVVAWLITPEKDGVFPITAQVNYAAVELNALRNIYILNPNGTVTGTFYGDFHPSLDAWLRCEELKNRR